jgi:vitamin B12 transporter
MKRIYRLIALAFLSGCGLALSAQTSGRSTVTGREGVPLSLAGQTSVRQDTLSAERNDSTRVLKEAVVIGVPDGYRYKEVIPAQTLEGEELQRLGSLSVADALRCFSGVQLKDYGGVGGLKTVNIRSLGTNHSAVFYDGIQLGNAQNGQVDLGRFSLDDVEQISLHNGQKSDILQSAKDFGASGTIYITTRRPRFEAGRRFNAKATFKTGSFGLVNPSFRTEYKISPTLSASLSGEWTKATGKYRFRYRKTGSDGLTAYDTTAVRRNGDVDATRVEASLHGTLPSGRWNLRAYSYNSRRGVPGAVVSNVFGREERLWDSDSFVQGSFRNRWNKWLQTLLNAKYAADYTHYENRDSRLIAISESYWQKEFYASCANLFSITDGWGVSLAYDFQWNTLDAKYFLPTENDGTFPYPTRFTNLVALATAFELGGLKGEASVLGNFVHEKTRRFEASPDKALATPAFFLSYKPFGRHDLTLRAFWKRMFRMPTFNDLYYTDMGNASLKPEYATQFNVGARFSREFRNMLAHPLVEVSVDGYRNRVTDKIIAYPKGQQFRWTTLNLGEVRITGLDAALDTRLSFGKLEAVVRLRYTWQDAVDVTAPSDSYYGDQIPYIPRHSGSAVVSLTRGGWSLNYSFIYTGERYSQQENIPRNYVQPWYTSDLSLQKVFTLGRCGLKVLAEVNNLFGQDYEVVLNYPMPKTNCRITTSLSF